MSINYSTRDFLTLISEINNDQVLKEQPMFFKTFIAGIFDVLNNTLNACMNAITPSNWYSRTIAQDILQLLDYSLSWKQTSRVNLQVTIDPSATASSSYTISKNNLIFSTQETTAKKKKIFEARNNLTFSIGTSVSSIEVFQQETKPTQIISKTNGSSFQRIDLPEKDIIKETLIVTIDSVQYELVETFAYSSANDKHYKLYYRNDGTSFIELGGIDNVTNNQFGFIPAAGLDVYVSFAVGGGSDSNVEANTIVEYLGNDPYFVSCINLFPARGGKNEETLLNASKIAPIRARSCEYLINESSAIALAKSFQDVYLASAKKSGLLEINCWIIPIGGGNPSSSLKNQVKEFLEKRSLLEEVNVNVLNPNYLNIDVHVKIKPKLNTNVNNIIRYSKLIICQRISENGEYVKEIYLSSGIESAISEINYLYNSLTGITYNSNDYVEAEKIISNTRNTEFGRNFLINDIVSSLAQLEAIDYVEVVQPSNDITLTDGYITTLNSLNVEII
jgi:hypothetical protein